jgi:YVTN family beta-propeller protein
MQVKMQLKAGAITTNHSQTLARDRARATAGTRLQEQYRPLKVKTQTRRAAGVVGHALQQSLTRGSAMGTVHTISHLHFWLFLVALLFAGGGAHAVSPTSLGVVDTVIVGSRPLDMALSLDGGRLYVVDNGPGGPANQGSISVVDTLTFGVITTTNPLGLGFPLEMAITPSGARGYLAVSKFSGSTTTAGADRVLIFDTTTDTITGSIPIGAVSPSLPNGTGPIGVALKPDGSRAYVTARFADRVYVINTATSSVMSSVTVGDRPIGIAVSPNGNRVYVANGLTPTVSVINTSTNAVVKTIAVGSGTSVSRTRVVLTPDGKRAYVIADNAAGNIAVIDTEPMSATFELQVALLTTTIARYRSIPLRMIMTSISLEMPVIPTMTMMRSSTRQITVPSPPTWIRQTPTVMAWATRVMRIPTGTGLRTATTAH